MRRGFLLSSIAGLSMVSSGAGAGEGFAVPPAGVLAPPRTITSIYDNRAMITGRVRPAISPGQSGTSIAVKSAVDARAAEAVPRAKTSAPRTTRVYVRRNVRPPATLPQKPFDEPAPTDGGAYTASVPSAPMPAAAAAPRGLFGQAQPPYGQAQTQRATSSVADMFLPARRSRSAERGLFSSSSAPAAAPVMQQPVPQPIPSQTQAAIY